MANLIPNSCRFVLFFPYTLSNPYQTILKEGLAQRGLKVDFSRGNSRSIIGYWRRHSPCQVVYHIHWLWPFFKTKHRAMTYLKTSLFLILFTGLRFFGSKVFWTVHNLYEHESNHLDVERWFRCRLAQLTDRIFVHSVGAVSLVSKEYKCQAEKMIVVPNPHYIDRYPNRVCRQEARRQLNLQQDAFIFLCFGRMRDYKGLDVLIEAFGEGGLGVHVHLVIAGYADKKFAWLGQVLEQAKRFSNIHVYDRFIKEEEVQFFFNACNVTVFPFKKILNSGSIVLAMSFKKACVAPRLQGVTDVLDEETSFLYDPSNPAGLKESLRQALRQGADLEAMGQANFKNAMERHSPEAVASAMYREYQSAVPAANNQSIRKSHSRA